jgi:hypothetical protein
MKQQIVFLLVAVVVAASTGCHSALGGWAAGVKRQYRQAMQEMKDDLSVLDSDHDGLDAFGPDAAKEMRAVRADMTR